MKSTRAMLLNGFSFALNWFNFPFSMRSGYQLRRTTIIMHVSIALFNKHFT